MKRNVLGFGLDMLKQREGGKKIRKGWIPWGRGRGEKRIAKATRNRIPSGFKSSDGSALCLSFINFCRQVREGKRQNEKRLFILGTSDCSSTVVHEHLVASARSLVAFHPRSLLFF